MADQSFNQQLDENDNPITMYSLAMELLKTDHPEQRNLKEAERLLRASARGNYSLAMITLGEYLLLGTYIKQNVNEGIQWVERYLQHPDGPDAFSIYYLGDSLLKEEDQKVKKFGKRLLQIAAEAEDIEAMITLGEYLLLGEYIEQNIEEGLRWVESYLHDHNEHHVYHIRPLGEKLIQEKPPKVQRLGKRLLQIAAEANDPYAMEKLATYLLTGEYIEQNVEQGLQWMEKFLRKHRDQNLYFIRRLGDKLIEDEDQATRDTGVRLLRILAEANDPDSMEKLGKYLLSGEYIERDVNEGIQWIERCLSDTKDQDFSAICHLGSSLIKDEDLIVHIVGEQLLRIAAEANHPDAMITLGEEKLSGEYIERNVEEGLQWIERYANNSSGQNTRSMYYLGEKLITKKEQEIRVMGERLLRLAAQTNDPMAMGILGKYLLSGEYMERNLEEGLQWIERFVNDSGDQNSYLTYVLGTSFLTNENRTVRKLGERLLRIAAEANQTQAMMELGEYLILGKYMERNLEEGLYWIDKLRDIKQYRDLSFSLLKSVATTLFRDEENETKKLALDLYLMAGEKYIKSEDPEIRKNGEELLHPLVDAEYPAAMFIWGRYLVEGKNLKDSITDLNNLEDLNVNKEELDEGIQWVTKAGKHFHLTLTTRGYLQIIESIMDPKPSPKPPDPPYIPPNPSPKPSAPPAWWSMFVFIVYIIFVVYMLLQVKSIVS